jgi:hypothetical protein
VGKVTDMTSLFEGLDAFNEDTSRWVVAQVTDMNRLLYGKICLLVWLLL